MLHLRTLLLCKLGILRIKKKKPCYETRILGWLLYVHMKKCPLPCQILFLVNYVLEFFFSPKENTYTLLYITVLLFYLWNNTENQPHFWCTWKFFLLSVLLKKMPTTYKWSKCKGQVKTIYFSKSFFFFLNVLQTVGSLFLMENTNRLGSIPSLLPIMRKLHLLSLAILRKSFAVIPTNPITDCWVASGVSLLRSVTSLSRAYVFQFVMWSEPL